MRGLVVAVALLALAGALQDFKCLRACAAKHQKGVNCLKKCELDNKKVFQRHAVGKGKIAKQKAVAALKKKGVVDPEAELLRQQVEADEEEQRRLMADLRDEDHKIERQREKEEAEKRRIQQEDRELAEELKKVAAERKKIITVERDEVQKKLKEKLDEHGQKLISKTVGGKLHVMHQRKHSDSHYACLRGCLQAIHNIVACRQRCSPAHQAAATKKKKKLTKAQLKKDQAKESAALKKGCGPCYGAQLKKGQCCNTCDEVKAAYAKRRWALPALSRMVQCKGAAAKAAHGTPHAHSRIFRSTIGKMQHETNKEIHSLLFNKLKRNTSRKGHFAPKKFDKAKAKLAQKKAQKQAAAVIRKWQQYHKKRWGTLHPNIVPTGFFKKMTPGQKVSKKAPVLHQQGLMLGMNQANLRKWQMLKIKQWSAPHQAVLKVKVIKAKKAALKAAKKHPELVKKAKKKKTATKKKKAAPKKKGKAAKKAAKPKKKHL